jgi:acylglycerol lipase
MAARLCKVACCAVALAMASCAGVRVKKTVKPSLGNETWTSFDGKVMPWKAGEPVKGKARGVVITVHGLSGAAMDFWMLEDGWPPKGVAVYGLQLRGMGNDPVKRARGDIRSGEQWQQDLLTFHRLVRERHPGVPIFWYSESLGSLIALHTVVSLMGDEEPQQLPAGVVFSSPAAGLRLRPKGAKASALYTMIALMPWMKVNLEQMGGVNDKDIRVTHDTTHGARMALTSHYVSHFSLRLLGEVDKMMRAAPEAASRLTVPLLVLASPNDVIASEDQVADFFERVPSKDKTIHWYRKSYHLLLHDAEREDVLRDATEWVVKRM